MFLCIICTAQKNDIWYPFYNQDSTLIGYKDEKNVVKIAPKFVPNFANRKFEHVMSVMEVTKNDWKDYFLTKTGKSFGIDSTYIFDYSFDCENEGFIRFQNKKKSENTGLFDINGKVIIPAKYNTLSKVMNGQLIALKNAKKKKDGEHFWWTDGEEILVDTNDNVLIENFKNNYVLDIFSLKINNQPILDGIHENYLGKNGKYYSFINDEKAFKIWFETKFIKNTSKENLIANTHPYIDSFEYDELIDNQKYIALNYSKIIKILNRLPTSEYSISKSYLDTFYLFDDKKFPAFEEYYDNCGQSKDWIYPLLSVTIHHKKGQDFLEFLKTKNGYKLVKFNTYE